jgi:hypothetical protein
MSVVIAACCSRLIPQAIQPASASDTFIAAQGIALRAIPIIVVTSYALSRLRLLPPPARSIFCFNHRAAIELAVEPMVGLAWLQNRRRPYRDALVKVCIIGKYPPIQGGVSTRTYWTAHGLARCGHEVHVVTNAKEATPPFRLHMRPQDWARCEASYGAGSVSVLWSDPVDRSQSYIPMAEPLCH